MKEFFWPKIDVIDIDSIKIFGFEERLRQDPNTMIVRSTCFKNQNGGYTKGVGIVHDSPDQVSFLINLKQKYEELQLFQIIHTGGVSPSLVAFDNNHNSAVIVCYEKSER